MSSCQLKLPFPQKKKVTMAQTTKDKLNDKGTIKSAHFDIIETIDCEELKSPRMTRSNSGTQLPQTPTSQRSAQCKTPRSTKPTSLQQKATPKTPSTLFNNLNINSPKTPSSLMRTLKIDSPKRKIDTALEFTSPKRKYPDADSDVVARSGSSVRFDVLSPRALNLFGDESEHKNQSSPQRRKSLMESPLKRSERLMNSPLKLNLPSDLKTERSTNSPNKNTGISPTKRCRALYKSPLKTVPSSKQSFQLKNSPLKNLRSSPMKLKSAADIENELFASDFEDSPKRLDSPLSKSNRTPLKRNIDSPPASAIYSTDSPRRSLRFESTDSPKKVNKFNLENRETDLPKKVNNKFNLENSETKTTTRSPFKNSETKTRSTQSPLKREEDYLKPLSPIKNIILDKKSPFKAFIRDDDLPKRSPVKLLSTRQRLFQSEIEPKAEEKCPVTVLSELPGREAQLDTIRQFLLSHLNNETAGSMYISGPPGTGKSASLNVIVQQSEIKDSFKTIYINCNSVKNAASVYATIVSELKLKPGGKSERHHLSAILKYFDTKHKSILLILDEIDALESRKQTILYTIFEWPSIVSSKLVLVGVANALDLTDRMLPRLEANVTLKPTLLNFSPYSKQQILEIISQKLKQTDKFNMFNASALQLLAGKVAAVSGDIRKAIDITNHLIDLTYDNVKENGEVVGIGLKDVLGVISSVYSTSQSLNCSRDQDSFPLQQKLTLASLLLLKSKPNVKDVTLGKLNEVYKKVCSQRNLAPLEMSEFISACSLLDARGVLKLYGKTKNRMTKVTLQWDEQDVKEALRDKHLVSTILKSVMFVVK
uniref:Cell division control protein 6 homolog n=1 Tax=Cacopsylla melanoneura TaxID=428564 RepID=A0A8D8VCG5_9HEMI